MNGTSWLAVAMLAVAGCNSSEAPTEPSDARPADDRAENERAENDREGIFDPLVETLDRSRGVQQTVDDQAAELRRRIEEAEGDSN
jgi:hypothetical protein